MQFSLKLLGQFWFEICFKKLLCNNSPLKKTTTKQENHVNVVIFNICTGVYCFEVWGFFYFMFSFDQNNVLSTR